MTRDEEHVYGRVPKSRRALFVSVLGVAGALVVAGGLLVAWLSHTGVQWGVLAAAVGFVLIALAIYLWIRLSD